MDIKLERYYQLKQLQKKIEQELSELRTEITKYCEQEGVSEAEIGSYKVKIVFQDRKEFDEQKLYEALPDLELWRMLSKPDHGKISGLLKLNVITEEKIKDTFMVKTVPVLQVFKI
ncbi:hypothetical protein [Cohnella sp.]|uniref:hypothetical protein n=1 Tax=Cohnella sp. TaxID=1883426 RepID=UPI00356ACE03